jgi:DNA transposase THAP9
MFENQAQVLCRKASRGFKWDSTTIKKAMQIRFACGATAYDLLLKHPYTLPSTRTLQQSIQHIHFSGGILHQIFDYMKIKVDHMLQEERLCCLTLDEMSIQSAFEYNVSLGEILGFVNLPEHKGTATNALVFMLSGLSSRWKQMVAFFFTQTSQCLKAMFINQ